MSSCRILNSSDPGDDTGLDCSSARLLLSPFLEESLYQEAHIQLCARRTGNTRDAVFRFRHVPTQ